MTVSIDGVRLSYETQGNGDSLLLVHGFPLSGAMWRPVTTSLGPGWRAIVPDLRGFGASDSSPRTSMARYADDLAALLDHLREERPVVLAGLSMGGYIAFEFARRYPERLRALVLANTRASADSPEQAAARRTTAERVRREGSSVVADQMMEKLFGPAAPGELRASWHEIMSSTAPAGVAAALEAMAERPDSTDTLASLERPVLIVAGAGDAIVPLDEARAMQAVARSAELEVIDGAGHLTPLEQPTRFNAALGAFLDRLPPLA